MRCRHRRSEQAASEDHGPVEPGPGDLRGPGGSTGGSRLDPVTARLAPPLVLQSAGAGCSRRARAGDRRESREKAPTQDPRPRRRRRRGLPSVAARRPRRCPQVPTRILTSDHKLDTEHFRLGYPPTRTRVSIRISGLSRRLRRRGGSRLLPYRFRPPQSKREPGLAPAVERTRLG